MDEVRRDATGEVGGFVVQKVHCDGAMLLDGGPCLCGPGGCWLVVLQCGCDCPTSVAVIRLDAAIDAVWPTESREIGSVIQTMDGRCWRLMGSTTQRPASAGEILASSVVAVFDDCDASPCNDDPCPPMPGFSFELTTCNLSAGVDPVRLSCLKRVRVQYRMFGAFQEVEPYPGGPLILRKSIIVDGEYTERFNEPTEFSFISQFKGINDRLSAGGGLYEWNFVQEIDQDSTGQTPGSVTPTHANPLFLDAPYQPSIGVPQYVAEIDARIFPPDGVPICNSRQDFDGDPSAVPIGFVENVTKDTPTFVWSQTTGMLSWPDDQVTRVSITIRIRIAEMELTDGTIIEFEDCDQPEPMVAVACDPKAEPQEIVYDAQLIAGSVPTIIDFETEQLYLPTTIPSDDDPVPFMLNPDGCPEPPDPTGDVYRINICNSTTRAGGGVIEGDVLIPKTIGYRPGDGLQPGEGMVWANIPVPTSTGNICLRRVACQPTTQVVTDAVIEYTSVAGNCRGQLVSNVDPRPGCAPVDGGGGVGPSDTLGLNAPPPVVDPRLNALAEGQIGRQYNCSSCG